MVQKTKTPPVKGPFLPGSIIWQKKGPLPVWAWLLIGLALVFVVTWWRRNRAASVASEAAQGYYRDELPGDQGAPPIFIMPPSIPPNVTVPITYLPPTTVPTAPPGGGASPPMTVIPGTLTAPANTNLYDWVKEMNVQYPGLHLDFGKLDLFNPNWRNTSGLEWHGKTSPKTPKLARPREFRVR